MNQNTHFLFLVGRISKGQKKLIFLNPPPRPPFRGPFELRAIFAR